MITSATESIESITSSSITPVSKNEKNTELNFFINYGDHVIAHIFDDNLGHFFVEPKGQFQCKFGLYFHDAIVGKPFGSKIYNHKETGYIHVLKFSPILWTKSLNHRTQILFETNISMILMYLNIRPGDRIVESGTGSGSLSTSFASAIYPNGHLFTFEFNQERFESAKYFYI